jgi:hypothetical protein
MLSTFATGGPVPAIWRGERLVCSHLTCPDCAADAAAVQLVLEEVLLSDVHLHPYELLGWEGVFGTAFMTAALPVLHVLPGGIKCDYRRMRPLPREL